jgi:hypothetical protein
LAVASGHTLANANKLSDTLDFDDPAKLGGHVAFAFRLILPYHDLVFLLLFLSISLGCVAMIGDFPVQGFFEGNAHAR